MLISGYRSAQRKREFECREGVFLNPHFEKTEWGNIGAQWQSKGIFCTECISKASERGVP